MNELLRQRYVALFNLYDVDADPIVSYVKNKIIGIIDDEGGLLRADAIYFLLVNFHHMIITPHFGYVPDPNYYGHSLPLYREANIPDLINEAFDVILPAVRERPQPASAHQVMLAIDQVWEQLSEIFLWG